MYSTKVFDESVMKNLKMEIRRILSSCDELKSKRTLSSPRAVGDIVQDIIAEQIEECFPRGLIKDISKSFARRAMADIAFFDADDNYFIVDIKTHNKSTHFNMPNLTSVERLSRFYEDDKNYFVILFVEYDVAENGVTFGRIEFVPVEHISWNCLTIGALGWGQIQIANANIINTDVLCTRKVWMLKLCDVLDVFYPKEIGKIEERIEHFKKVRLFWHNKGI